MPASMLRKGGESPKASPSNRGCLGAAGLRSRVGEAESPGVRGGPLRQPPGPGPAGTTHLPLLFLARLPPSPPALPSRRWMGLSRAAARRLFLRSSSGFCQLRPCCRGSSPFSEPAQLRLVRGKDRKFLSRLEERMGRGTEVASFFKRESHFDGSVPREVPAEGEPWKLSVCAAAPDSG